MFTKKVPKTPEGAKHAPRGGFEEESE